MIAQDRWEKAERRQMAEGLGRMLRRLHPPGDLAGLSPRQLGRLALAAWEPNARERRRLLLTTLTPREQGRYGIAYKGWLHLKRRLRREGQNIRAYMSALGYRGACVRWARRWPDRAWVYGRGPHPVGGPSRQRFEGLQGKSAPTPPGGRWRA